jgi:hypothetical protein
MMRMESPDFKKRMEKAKMSLDLIKGMTDLFGNKDSNASITILGKLELIQSKLDRLECNIEEIMVNLFQIMKKRKIPRVRG